MPDDFWQLANYKVAKCTRWSLKCMKCPLGPKFSIFQSVIWLMKRSFLFPFIHQGILTLEGSLASAPSLPLFLPTPHCVDQLFGLYSPLKCLSHKIRNLASFYNKIKATLPLYSVSYMKVATFFSLIIYKFLQVDGEISKKDPTDLDELSGGFDEFFDCWQGKIEFFFDCWHATMWA